MTKKIIITKNLQDRFISLVFCLLFTALFTAAAAAVSAQEPARENAQPAAVGVAQEEKEAQETKETQGAKQEPLIKAGGSLTLEQCIELTLQNNPKIASVKWTEEAQKSSLAQTKSGYFPQVSASAGYTRSDQETATGYNGAAESYSSSVSASQLIYDFGTTSLGVDIQKKAYLSAQENTRSTINDIIYQLKQAYYNVHLSQASCAVYAQSVEQYQEQLKRAQAFYDVGTRSKIDVTTAQVNLNNAKLNLIQAQNALKISKHTLLNVMGIYNEEPDFEVELKDTAVEYNITARQALEEAYKNRPDLVSYQFAVESARQNVKLSRTGFTPQLNANASYGWSGKNFPLYDRWSYGASLSWAIFSGLSTYNKVEQSKANLQGAYANLSSAKQNVLLEINSAYVQMQDASSSIPVAELTRRQAQENYDLAVGRYTVGVGNYIEVKDAESTLSDAKLSYIKAVYAYNLAVAELKRAMGTR